MSRWEMGEQKTKKHKMKTKHWKKKVLPKKRKQMTQMTAREQVDWNKDTWRMGVTFIRSKCLINESVDGFKEMQHKETDYSYALVTSTCLGSVGYGLSRPMGRLAAIRISIAMFYSNHFSMNSLCKPACMWFSGFHVQYSHVHTSSSMF